MWKELNSQNSWAWYTISIWKELKSQNRLRFLSCALNNENSWIAQIARHAKPFLYENSWIAKIAWITLNHFKFSEVVKSESRLTIDAIASTWK